MRKGQAHIAQVIPFMYSSEVFPQVYREVGMSLACAVNFSFAGALAMAVPQYANEITSKHLKLLGVFAVLDGIAAVFVWLYMRSPEGAKSLEDMNVWHSPLPPTHFLLIPTLAADLLTRSPHFSSSSLARLQ